MNQTLNEQELGLYLSKVSDSLAWARTALGNVDTYFRGNGLTPYMQNRMQFYLPYILAELSVLEDLRFSLAVLTEKAKDGTLVRAPHVVQ